MGLALHNSPVDLAFANKHFPVPSPRLSVIRKPRSAHPKAVARALLDRGFAPEDLPAFSRDAHAHAHEPRRREHRARRHGTANDTDDDGVRLARSSVPLPSDNSRDRVPSLERQNAFWDPRTTKRPAAPALTDDAEVAELYRLGLLYDDDHARGAGFGLDAIVNEAPAYSITTRARRRARRGPGKAGAVGLHMDWDFTGLEDDDEVARYLLSRSGEAARMPDVHRRRGYRTVWRSLPVVDEPVDSEDGRKADETPELIPDDADECDGRIHDDEDDDETDWAVLPRERDTDDTTLRTEDAATGVWIVLGDGS